MASGEEEGLFDFLPEQAAPERVGGGLPRLRFAERMQTRWRPVSLDGLLPDDHRGRLVWSFVEGLDLTALLATIKAVDRRSGCGAGVPAGACLHRIGASRRGEPGSCRPGRGAGARLGGGGVVPAAFDLAGVPVRGRKGGARSAHAT